MQREDGSSRRVPAYVEVLRALRRETLGRPPGSPLSSERELAARFGVGRMTVRAAVRALTQEGVLFVRRGAGAFIAQARVEVPGHTTVPIGTADADRGSRTRVLRFDRIGADAPAAEALRVPIGAAVFRIERLLFEDTTLVAHERSSIAVDMCPSLFRYNLEQVPVSDALAREGIVIVSATEEVLAAAAGRLFASLVHGRATDPVLVIRRTTFSSRDRAVEWSIATYRADRYRATYRVPFGPTDAA